VKARHFIPSLLIAAITAATALPSLACEVTGNDIWTLKRKLTRKPFAVDTDCSFKNAGGVHSETFGGPAVDIGEGRTAQAISAKNVCTGLAERLLFVDCSNTASLLLQPKEDYSLSRFQTVAEMLYPQGPIRITSDTTVAGLAEEAKALGIYVIEDLDKWTSASKPNRRYDRYCGCKHFYPDSPGAKL
jgi:hypothetical protein